MRRKNVKTMVMYFYAVPGMVKLLEQERWELEDEYNGLRGTSVDGLPHGSSPGKPTEMLAERIAASDTWERIQEIAVVKQIYSADAAAIRGCIDALNYRHKDLLYMRYRRGYSWAKIAGRMGTSEATARRWNERALDRLGELLEDVPMIDEILGRASRARV